jgi:hypothetical protein
MTLDVDAVRLTRWTFAIGSEDRQGGAGDSESFGVTGKLVQSAIIWKGMRCHR